MRFASGIYCAQNLGGNIFSSHTRWGDAFADTHGWGVDYYGATIQFGDIDGDGKADVCGRGHIGIQCTLSTGTGFGPPAGGRTISGTTKAGRPRPRTTDVNGDGKADVCGRGIAGILCGLSQGTSYATPTLWNGAYSDDNGWDSTSYGPNIQFADLNGDGKADVCVRGQYGLECWKSP